MRPEGRNTAEVPNKDNLVIYFNAGSTLSRNILLGVVTKYSVVTGVLRGVAGYEARIYRDHVVCGLRTLTTLEVRGNPFM